MTHKATSDSDRGAGEATLELSDDLRILHAAMADYAGVTVRYPMSRVEKAIVDYARKQRRAARKLSPLQISALLEQTVRETCCGDAFWKAFAARLQEAIEQR